MKVRILYLREAQGSCVEDIIETVIGYHYPEFVTVR